MGPNIKCIRHISCILQEVNNIVIDYRQDSSGAWIGLHDKTSEGRFEWTDGSPVNYTMWRPGEPNDYLRGRAKRIVFIWGRETAATGTMDHATDYSLVVHHMYVVDHFRRPINKIHPGAASGGGGGNCPPPYGILTFFFPWNSSVTYVVDR